MASRAARGSYAVLALFARTGFCPWTHHIILLLAINESFIPELLDGNEYTDPIANLFYSNLLKDLLIAFKQVISVKIIRYLPC